MMVSPKRSHSAEGVKRRRLEIEVSPEVTVGLAEVFKCLREVKKHVNKLCEFSHIRNTKTEIKETANELEAGLRRLEVCLVSADLTRVAHKPVIESKEVASQTEGRAGEVVGSLEQELVRA